MKKRFIALKFLFAYFILLTIFLISIILSCLIPSSLIKQNIGKSLITLKKEGIYPSFGLPWRQIILDNFTDALMLNTAYSVNSKEPVKAALLNIRYNSKTDHINQIANLESLLFSKEIEQINYERYWHGYLVFLRPLLVFFSYSQIRIILSLFLFLLLAIFILIAWKKLGLKTTFAFILGLITVDFFYIGQSLQFSTVFLIGLLSSLYLLYTYKKSDNLYLLFFVIGALTSFFDLLSAPLITLGMLLIVAESLEKKNRTDIFLYCLLWSIGYLLLWFSKWLIVQVLFAPGAIATALNKIVDRTVNQADANFSHFNALKLNFFQLIGYNRINKIVILLLFIIFLIFFIKYSSFRREKINKVIAWILIGIIPYLWYLIAANHSYIHVWFTYRNQFMSIVCLFLVAAEFVNWPHITAKKRHKN